MPSAKPGSTRWGVNEYSERRVDIMSDSSSVYIYIKKYIYVCVCIYKKLEIACDASEERKHGSGVKLTKVPA